MSWKSSLLVVPVLAAAAFGATSAPAPDPIGIQPLTNHRNPPPYRKLSDAEAARYDFGMGVFNTPFVVAGTVGAGRRDGVGPLFNAASCDQCHNNGAHGRGPTGDGPAPTGLVIQLTTPSSSNSADPEGGPVYGRVFNTLALDSLVPEGVAMIHYEKLSGHYPDGASWQLRSPHYQLTNLQYGPLDPRTIVKPRLAPALFGTGLLDAVDQDRLPGTDAARVARFGWQASALSVRDQTARAFAREMGLTSADIPHDDCTAVQTQCLKQPNGGLPEVSAEIFHAVLDFQRWLAVPASPKTHSSDDGGGRLFTEVGCSACHQAQLRVTLTDSAGRSLHAVIAPYTDLRTHDLGDQLADEDIAGKKASGKWRTAPLWGLGYRLSLEKFPTFLHDGRARSVEEAILWHAGEASTARTRFEELPAAQRDALLRWVETL